MKKVTLILSLFLLAIPEVWSQGYIALSVEAGEHSWLGKMPTCNVNGSLGAGGGLGLHYEVQHKGFLFTFGVQGNVHHSLFQSEQEISFWADDGDQQIKHAYSAEGIYGNFTYQYNFYDRRDQYTNVVVQVPLMFGGQVGNFYALAGAKFQTMSLWAQAVTDAKYTSKGIYPGMYAGMGDQTFQHMPEHGFFDEQYLAPQKTKADFLLNALVSAEIGYTTDVKPYFNHNNRRKYYRFRVGAYADYGVLNGYRFNYDATSYVTPLYNSETAATAMKEIQVTHILDTSDRAAIIRPLQVGVKFTVLFQLPQPKICVICEQGLETYKYW